MLDNKVFNIVALNNFNLWLFSICQHKGQSGQWKKVTYLRLFALHLPNDFLLVSHQTQFSVFFPNFFLICFLGLFPGCTICQPRLNGLLNNKKKNFWNYKKWKHIEKQTIIGLFKERVAFTKGNSFHFFIAIFNKRGAGLTSHKSLS